MLQPARGSWLAVLFAPRGTLSNGVFWRLLFITLLTLGIGLLNHHGYHWIRIPVGLYEVSGAVIALTLSFRTNTAYNRFWEGRTLWGGVVNACRNLQRGFQVHAKLNDEESRTVSTWIVVFAHAMRRGLRSENDFPEVERLLSADDFRLFVDSPHRALYASSRISDFLRNLVEQGRLNPMMQRHLEALNATLVDYLGGCERILKTPTPLGYVLLIERCNAFYIITLPLALVEELGMLCVPVTMMAAYLVLMIEGLGRELDDPFGHEPNDLPLSRICETIERNLLGSSPEEILRPSHKHVED